MAIWSELHCILKHYYRLIDVTEITKELKATGKRIAKVVQPKRLVWMVIWSQLYCILKHQHRLVDVIEIAKVLKATGKRIAKTA